MAAVVAAGLGAGAINTVVGSGTLITFPILLAVGYSPVLANVTNTVGLAPGGVSGAYGYRAELAGQRRRLVALGALAVAGGLSGGLLLLALPEEAFRVIVPVLVGVAVVLVAIQPRVGTRARSGDGVGIARGGRIAFRAGIFGTGLYGGYFGAAQGVLLVGLMGVFLDEDLQRVNAAKNVLATLVNATAALLFVAVSDVAWAAVALLAVGSVIGGQLGARVGRRLPAPALRAVVIAVGLVALVALMWR
ncbi:MAG TPA: sulfite exporter TauE/SafE family protein [Acidimicrobiales bacterium]